jgi:hypothetical protein
VVSARRARPWLWTALLVAGVTGGTFVVVHAVSTRAASDTGSQATPVPTRPEAEALLSNAYRLAQAHDYAGLCQTVAQDPRACQQVLRWADTAHATASADLPSVVSVSTVPDTRTAQGAEVLHIRGTRADGTAYTNDFSAVRTATGQIRSQNAVYWYSTYAAPSR